MHKEHYIHQKFLIETSASDINISDFDLGTIDDRNIPYFSEEYNLFDCDSYIRRINLSDFDTQIDTEDEFNALIQKIKPLDCLYIKNDRKNVNNPIFQSFSNQNLQAILKKIADRHIVCKVYKSLTR